MASIKKQIASYAAGANVLAFVTGLPSGLSVREGSLIPSTAGRQPEMTVYVGPEIRWDPVGMRSRGNPVLRAFRLIVEIRTSGAVTVAPHTALDPLEVWAETRLFADETFGGLASGIVGWTTDQAAHLTDAGYYMSTVACDVEFTTKRGLPESRGDA